MSAPVTAQAFVGRELELRTLREQHAAMRAGEPRFVLVQAPAGVGKTSLLTRFTAELDGTRVIRAGGDESETDLPLALIDQILRLARVGTAVDHVAAGAQLLDALGELAPVVLVVDDAHWADPVSLRALLFAARRLADEAVLILVAARDEPADALPRGLHALFDGAHGARLALRAFDASELQALADVHAVALSPGAAQRLHEHTGGNALYATALLQEYPPERWERPADQWPAPRSYAALVQRRLEAAPPEARALAEALAVLGGASALTTVAQVAQLHDRLDAVDEAARRGLLALHDGTLRFRHPLIRAAILQGLSEAARARLHARAAEALADDEPLALRHAAAAASGPDDALAARLEAFARTQSQAGAWPAAASALLAAGRLASEREERERLLLDTLETTLYAGDAAGARRLAPEAERALPGARRDAVLAYAAISDGHAAEAQALLGRAWGACDHGSPLASKIAERSAFLGILRLRAADAIEWGRKAAALAAGDPAAVRLSIWALATALDMSGRAEEAAAVLDDADRRAGGPAADRTRAVLALAADRLGEAREQLTAAAPAIQRYGSFVGAALANANLARAEFLAGAWDDAALHAERAVGLALESDDVAAQAFAFAAAVLVPAARGQSSEHAAALAAVPAVFENHIVVRAVGLAASATEAAAVLDALEPVRRIEPRDGVDDPGHWPWAHLYAEALVDSERLEEAGAFLSEHEAIATAYGRRSAQARLARVRGRLQALTGEPAEAAFAASVEQLAELGMPFELGLSELAYGRFLRRDGRRRAAAERLRAAVRRFESLHAQPSLERALRELDACGLTPAPRRTPAAPDALTPQERAVERLAASGLTNREIATELMLSVKTVERHLSHVFAKRGVSSRGELDP